jgi:2-polyprenyl-3-methyl-5-hydroxy-6-metoxy-1,4-benzoquinol methylase
VFLAVGTARYDEIADTYAQRPDDYSNPATAAMLDLLGPVHSQRVLDLACGHGLISRHLARCGAEVTGVDLSEPLVDAARVREGLEPLGITYLQADVSSPELLATERFDAATCNFGLSDIEKLAGTLANLDRLLVPDGRFVFSILHPCFPGAHDISGSWPADSTYYDELWWRAEGTLSTIRNRVGANHRMVSTYLNLLVEAGLVIDRVAEPRPDEVWAKDRPGVSSSPVYLAVRSVKPR